MQMRFPLSKTVPDVGPGGGIVTAMNGMNALANNMLNTQLTGVKAQYAPYQAMTNALTNPMLWMAIKDNPSAQNAVLQNLQNVVGGMGTGMGSGQPHQSLIDKVVSGIGNVFDGSPTSSSSGNALNNPPQTSDSSQPSDGTQNSPLLPSQGGIGNAISGKMSAGYVQSPYPSGALITDPSGQPRSVPTGGTVDASQTAISAIDRVQPMLKEVISDAPKFLQTGKIGKLDATGVLNSAEQYFGGLGGVPDYLIKKMGMTKQDVSDYNNWKANIANASESVMKGLNLPQNADSLSLIKGILTPTLGEDGKGYASRVQRQLSLLEMQKQQNQQFISQGFPVSGSSAPQQTAEQAAVAQQGVVPYIMIRNPKTGETMRISRDEARKAGVKNA